MNRCSKWLVIFPLLTVATVSWACPEGTKQTYKGCGLDADAVAAVNEALETARNVSGGGATEEEIAAAECVSTDILSRCRFSHPA